MISNRANLVGIDPGPLLPHIQAGTIRPLAVAAKKRLPALPDVLTVEETGIAKFDDYVWWGIAAPRSRPAPILDQLNELLRAASSDPSVKERFTPLQIEALAPRRDEIETRIQAST